MWCDTNAELSLAQQNVFLSCPPTASTFTGKATATSIGEGTNPRDRRSMVGLSSSTRITESSQRSATGRS